MERVKDVLRAASRFSIGTMLSRSSGLMRDVAIAYAFGGSSQIAGFMVAFRLANLFRRMLGEGVLQTGFIPAYEKLKNENVRYSTLLYRDMLWSIAVLAIGLSAGSILILRGMEGWFGAEWSGILHQTEIMIPSLLWISLFGLDAALLQAEKRSFWAGFAPSLFNFGMVAAIWMARESAAPMSVLAIGVVGSFGLQWLIAASKAQECFRGMLSWREWMSPFLFSLDVRRVLAAMGLGMIGVGAMQLNSAFDAVFARIADPSGPAFLWYAIRLYQLPMALVAIALSSALLPSLVRKQLEGNEQEQTFFEGVLNKGMEVILICGLALFAFAQSGVNLLFGHGHFSPYEVTQTTHCLWAYGAGFIPAALVLLFAQGCYAKQSFSKPVAASLYSVVFHLLLNALLVFVFHLGAISIALSTSGGAFLNYYLLKRGQDVSFQFPLKTFLVSLSATALCLLSDQWFGISREVHWQLAHLATNGLLFWGPIGLTRRAFRIA